MAVNVFYNARYVDSILMQGLSSTKHVVPIHLFLFQTCSEILLLMSPVVIRSDLDVLEGDKEVARRDRAAGYQER